jgi:hypothetical protein
MSLDSAFQHFAQSAFIFREAVVFNSLRFIRDIIRVVPRIFPGVMLFVYIIIVWQIVWRHREKIFQSISISLNSPSSFIFYNVRTRMMYLFCKISSNETFLNNDQWHYLNFLKTLWQNFLKITDHTHFTFVLEISMKCKPMNF